MNKRNEIFTKEEVLKLLKKLWENEEKRRHLGVARITSYLGRPTNFISQIHICKREIKSQKDFDAWQERIIIWLKDFQVKEFDLEKIEKNIERISICFKILYKKQKDEYAYYFAKCFNKYALIRTKTWIGITYKYSYLLEYDDMEVVSTDENEIKKELILLGIS